MIAKEFEEFILREEKTFLTPARNLAVLIDTHNVDHAILVLSQISYTRVPVVTDPNEIRRDDFFNRYSFLPNET